MAVGEVSSPGAAALAENIVGLSAGNGEQQQQLEGRDELRLSKKARKVEKRKEKLEEERRLREEAKRKKTYPFFSSYH